jgi:sigma-B regulation protein RsbU (phosphoserine phosphatase)
MIAPPMLADEAERLADLRSLNILDTPPEERFDRIVKVAAAVFDVPISYIALIDSERQWFKARRGVCKLETDRKTSFCGHTIAQDEPLIVPDALLDDRFAENPMVTGDPYIRFYAGVPLEGPGGHNIATLCLADTKPRDFSSSDLAVLTGLAEMAQRELQMVDLIEAQARLIDTQAELVRTQHRLSEELDEAARYVRSQLPEPMDGDSPVRIDWRFESSSQVGGDAFGYHWLDESKLAVYLLDVSGHGVGAALMSSSIHTAISRQTLSANFTDPATVVAALDRAFPMHQSDNKFFTCFYGVYDAQSRTLDYASAGHPPALLFAPTGERRNLPSTTAIIGIGQTTEDAERLEIAPGSRLYFFSDGAFEIPDPDTGDLLMPEGLARLIERRAAEDGCRACLDDLVEHLRRLSGGTFSDDFSIVAMDFPAT